jgi:hypothetical protein
VNQKCTVFTLLIIFSLASTVIYFKWTAFYKVFSEIMLSSGVRSRVVWYMFTNVME